jgi:hypothetical protein
MQQQVIAAFDPIAVSAVLVAIVMAASRLAPFTKPYWTFLPKVVQAWLPSLVAGFPVALNAFGAVKTWMDFAQAVLVVGAVPLALAVPGMSSPHNHPEQPPPDGGSGGSDDEKPKRPKVPPLAAAGMLLLGLTLSGCSGLFGPATPYLAEAAVVIADAGNAVNAAEALLPSLHLNADAEASAKEVFVRARAALSAAAAAVDGAKDLTNEQLDSSLSAFRSAWADIQRVFAGNQSAARRSSVELPVPLAVRRVRQ